MKIYIINGPNLNMLGIREPDIYGRQTYEMLVNELAEYCAVRDVEPIFVQSNHEGELVTAIQNAYFEEADGIVINPAAYTHTSVALLDALKAVALPTVEVHLSDVSAREAFRQISYVREACIATICGKGFDGYKEAIDILLQK
jgi:3-dehydroquinate dehydratase-2